MILGRSASCLRSPSSWSLESNDTLIKLELAGLLLLLALTNIGDLPRRGQRA